MIFADYINPYEYYGFNFTIKNEDPYVGSSSYISLMWWAGFLKLISNPLIVDMLGRLDTYPLDCLMAGLLGVSSVL